MALMPLAMAAAVLAGQPAPRFAPPVPTRATDQLHAYFSTDDYPEAAIRRGAQGTVHFSLVIGRDGRPTRRIVDQSAGDPDLDRVTREILISRARFTPARDARGRAVEDRGPSCRLTLEGRDPVTPDSEQAGRSDRGLSRRSSSTSVRPARSNARPTPASAISMPRAPRCSTSKRMARL